MKKLVILICFIATSGFIQAQTGTPNQPKTAKHQKIKMAKELNFSKSQKQEAKAIAQKNKEQEQAINNNTTLSEADKKQQLKQLKLEKKKEMAKILTTEQKAKLADLQQKKATDKPKTK